MNCANFLRKKRIIICGKSGSGKDFLKNYMKEKNYKIDVSATTRPIRPNEKEGETYFFLTDKQFEEMEKEEKFYQCLMFNNWKYGTFSDSWNNNEVFIMVPSAIKTISKEDRKESLIVYLDIDQETRKERLIKRTSADCLERRMEADERDFCCFVDFDIQINDPLFDCSEILEDISFSQRR